MVFPLNRPKSIRVRAVNKTMIKLRTRHATNDNQQRGFHLNYRSKTFCSIISMSRWIFSGWFRPLEDEEKQTNSSEFLTQVSLCGKKYSQTNGTIELKFDSNTAIDCLVRIEVEDGQNILLRLDQLDWDSRENQLEIGLEHDPDRLKLFTIKGFDNLRDEPITASDRSFLFTWINFDFLYEFSFRF